MKRAQKVTLKTVEAIAEQLRGLPEQKPEQREVGKQEAVAVLKDDIEAVRARGYSYEQIAEYLKGGGLDIGGAALKSYLTRAKASVKAPAKPKPAPKAEARPKADSGAKMKAAVEAKSETKSETGKGSFPVKPDRPTI